MLTSIVVAISLAFAPMHAAQGRHGSAKSKTVHVKAYKTKGGKTVSSHNRSHS